MPADGWFYFYIYGYVLPYSGCIKINGYTVYSSAGSSTQAADDITGAIPVCKGDIITVKSYYPSDTTYTFDGRSFAVDGRSLTQLIFFKNKS